MLSSKHLDEFKEYLKSGKWEEDYGYRTRDGQEEMLDMLDSLFELCDIADEILTRKFYKNILGDKR